MWLDSPAWSCDGCDALHRDPCSHSISVMNGRQLCGDCTAKPEAADPVEPAAQVEPEDNQDSDTDSDSSDGGFVVSGCEDDDEAQGHYERILFRPMTQRRSEATITWCQLRRWAQLGDETIASIALIMNPCKIYNLTLCCQLFRRIASPLLHQVPPWFISCHDSLALTIHFFSHCLSQSTASLCSNDHNHWHRR